MDDYVIFLRDGQGSTVSTHKMVLSWILLGLKNYPLVISITALREQLNKSNTALKQLQTHQ